MHLDSATCTRVFPLTFQRDYSTSVGSSRINSKLQLAEKIFGELHPLFAFRYSQLNVNSAYHPELHGWT
jgi:hypothetical protein